MGESVGSAAVNRRRTSVAESIGRVLVAALVLVLAPGARGARADSAEAARADYERLQEWRFSGPVAVPEGGLSFARETATWVLETGEVRLQEPTADGAVTGLVFEGRGRFRMEVPDAAELRQLRRFAGEPELERLEETFDRLVLRTSEPALPGRLVRNTAIGGALDASAANASYEPDDLARERHDHWLRIRRHDADARVVFAMLDPDEEYLRVDFRTEERGWLTFDFDSRLVEPVRLERFHPAHSFLESWVSLRAGAGAHDPAGSAGRAGSTGSAGPAGSTGPVGPVGPVGPDTPSAPAASPKGPAADVEHASIAVELLKLGRDASAGAAWQHRLLGEFRAELDVRVHRAGRRALQLYLHPWAEVRGVADGSGRALPFLRDHIGERSRGIDKRVYDDSLVVLLPEPPEAGAVLRLVFDYELEIDNFLPGRRWYPSLEGGDLGLADLHTARIEVTTRESYDVRAMGERIEDSVEGKLQRRVWEISEPVKMATFTLTQKAREQRIEAPGVPAVVVFGPPVGHDTENRFHYLGVDVAESVRFYHWLLEDPLPEEVLLATLIQAFHGQSFDGFLHLSEWSAFRSGGTGVTRLFVAHEVAHQWWGHRVGWATYRDQWLSEALANYSALMFVEATSEEGGEIFEEALRAYTDEVTGSLKSAFNRFARGGSALDNQRAAKRLGPIGHGYRAAVGESPGAYFTQAYRKGSLVLHMMRRILEREAGPGAFVEMLRDFERTHRGGYPSTADLEAAAARRVPGDWSGFFDQWVHGTEIPTYRWSHRAAKSRSADGSYALELTVRQQDVPPGFAMPVPVRVEYAGGESEELTVRVDEPEETFTLKLRQRPKRVELNPDFAVLARVKKGA